MTLPEKRKYLIRYLQSEQPDLRDMPIPADEAEQKRILRSLFNIRMPSPVSEEFLRVQDEYLKAQTAAKGITDYKTLPQAEAGIYLWRGDITTLKCDAIVNAANNTLLGCFCPGHECIDNAIHTYAGVQLRAKCADIMQKQGHAEATGKAKITSAYNLPCKYIIHTVGPIVSGSLTKTDEELLASCYRSCLEVAEQNGAESIAFCCISTGEFHFPNQKAAEIALKTVREYLINPNRHIEVIFNVFKQQDLEIYRKLLG